jgi:hypothetical protein
MDILLEGGAALQKRDYTLIVDQSFSMATFEDSEEKSRWEMMQDSTLALTTQCEHFDPNGITVYLFAEEFQQYDHVTSEKVARIFQTHQPQGKANLAPVLKQATAQYFKRRALEIAQANGEIILVVTAGDIKDPEAVKQVIINAADQLYSDEELGIELIQVGSNRQAARFFKALDQDLQRAGAKFDICHTVSLEDVDRIDLNEILLSAIAD